MSIEIVRDDEVAGGERDPHRRGPRLRRATAPSVRRAPSRPARRAARTPRAHRRGRAARLPARDRRHARPATGACRPRPTALIDRRVEITGPAMPAKMAINALNSGARVWLADMEDASSPDLGERRRQRAQPARCGARHPRLHVARGQGLRAAHRPAPPDRRHPAPRLAPAREARAHRRRARLGVARRLRAALLPHGAAAHRQRRRPVLLPAETREPPRGATLERRVRVRAGGARHPAGHRAGDRADRDDHRGVRDGRDPVRAARAHVGPQRGPLGLPVQHHQGVPRRRPRVHRARPGVGVDDGAVHARLHRAAREDLPSPGCGRDGRHGGVRAEPRRPRGHGRRVREGARRQDPRGERRVRRLMGRASRSRPGLPRGVRRGARRPAEPARPATARGRGHRRRSCSTSPPAAARSPRRACAPTSRSVSPTRRPGSPAAARSRCTASWRTPPPPRSRARRCGSTCSTASCSPTPGAR